MFPPVEESVLRNNPDFANLYRALTTTILNPDGSTKNDSEAKERAAVQKSLDKHRLRTAKHHLLERAIASATPPDSKPVATAKLPRAGERNQQRQLSSSSTSLPEPLLDLLLILPPFLDAASSLPRDSIALLLSSPPLSDFESLLPDLTDLISSNLHASALSLARLTHTSTNPSYLHRHISSLPQDLANLKASVSTAEQTLTAARLRTLASLTDLLQTYSQCVMYLVRSLEAKHGVVARSLELRASDVSLEAQRGEKQSEQAMWKLRKEVYSPDIVLALQNYMAHLKDAKMRGAERVRGLEAELETYGVGAEGGGKEGKEKVMREMARVYKGMRKQMDDANNDLDRLRNAS